MEKIIINISWCENYGASSESNENVLGCAATHQTLEGVKEAYKSALDFHLESVTNTRESDKVLSSSDYELVFKMDVHALLHHFDGIITKSALSRITGINEKQLGHYAQGHRKPRQKQREKIINGLRRIGNEFINVV